MPISSNLGFEMDSRFLLFHATYKKEPRVLSHFATDFDYTGLQTRITIRVFSALLDRSYLFLPFRKNYLTGMISSSVTYSLINAVVLLHSNHFTIHC